MSFVTAQLVLLAAMDQDLSKLGSTMSSGKARGRPKTGWFPMRLKRCRAERAQFAAHAQYQTMALRQ